MKKVRKLLLYFHTVKYLKFKQVFYRLYYRFYLPKINCHVKQVDIKYRLISQYWTIPVYKKEYFIDGECIAFLNHQVKISGSSIWNDPGQEKLWLYNLHYFDALNSASEKQRELACQLLERWVDENPPFIGNGWEPYPISLRIVNIIKYQLGGNVLSEKILKSLYLQARYLVKHCEFHLLGNHLFENLKALCFAGLFFNTNESKKWYEFAVKHLKKQVQEQVLEDGGHFELSPMYHGIILEGLLDLHNLFVNYAIDFPWVSQVNNMLMWLQYMSRPNDEYSYFNDSTNGIAAKPLELFSYAQRLGYVLNQSIESTKMLKDSGYFIYISGRIKSIIDVARIGPDYLPGHAHADTLSFELYVDGYPVFVNLGASCYGNGERRFYERSTTAHNTVEINQQNSSEIWSGFRVACRAYPKDLQFDINSRSVMVEAAHSGYQRLTPAIIHHRRFNFEDGEVEINDKIEGKFKQALAFFHIHPDCKLTEEGGNISILLPNNRSIVMQVGVGQKAIIEDALYANEFGKKLPTKCIKLELSENNHYLIHL